LRGRREEGGGCLDIERNKGRKREQICKEWGRKKERRIVRERGAIFVVFRLRGLSFLAQDAGLIEIEWKENTSKIR
jgi:hypothetical protein